MYEVERMEHQKELLECVLKYEKENPNRKWDKVAEEMNAKFKEKSGKETWRSRFRLINDEYRTQLKNCATSYYYSHDIGKRLLSYLKKGKTLEFLQKSLNLEEMELLAYLQKLQLQGHIIEFNQDTVKLLNAPIVKNKEFKLYEGKLKKHTFCVVSDTHLGNKKQQLTLLNHVYDECEKKGITTVFHCGDISDGQSNRPEHRYELFAQGATEQAEYIINNYPKRKGITTYFITGNHDGWHYKSGGTDIGKIIANGREDMIYLGNQKARVMINDCKIDLFHPQDGSAYSVSYSGQKTIEAIRGGDKPNIMFTGHHHKFCYFVTRNIHYMEVPCLCGPTSFIEGKRIENVIGAVFPSMEIDELGNVIKFNPEVQMFYNTKENDYELQKDDVRKITKIK